LASQIIHFLRERFGMRNKTIRIAILTLSSLWTTISIAQTCHNLYPYADGAVYDNNGYDLRGFVKKNKTAATEKGNKINEYSENKWGYLMVNTVRVPSVSTPHGKWHDVSLNHSEYIDATLAMCVTKESLKSTWWARQCNSPLGPLVCTKVDDEGRLDVPNVRYTDISKELEIKKFTIVEYTNDRYNPRDYDVLANNYLLIENGLVRHDEDYKTIINFYNNFLSKFTYLDDPLLETKSFVTFFHGRDRQYVGYFKIANSKLAGHLETIEIRYERDKEIIVNSLFSKLNTRTVYVYGDDTFSLEKAMLKYAREHDLKLITRATNTTEKFNEK
jgi:hypothetical protein